jgi:hypothetical protein
MPRHHTRLIRKTPAQLMRRMWRATGRPLRLATLVG